MNTKQLTYVQVLAREGSFSRAADTLGITQPSLSQYVKKIEREIGQELFDRTNGDVRITDAGRAYLETGRKILDLEHQLENRLSDLAGNRAGSLVVGAAPYRAAGMMPAIAREFRKLHPGMHLIVREGTTAELAEGMTHGEYDLALTLMPVDGRLFHSLKVMEEELVLAVPADREPLPAAELEGRRFPAIDAGILSGRRFVMLTDTQFMQKQLENLCLDYGLKPETAAVVKSLEAQIAMVKAGIGIALMPSGIERFSAPGEVCFYSFRQPLPKREVAIIWRKDLTLSRAAEDLKRVICSISW